MDPIERRGEEWGEWRVWEQHGPHEAARVELRKQKKKKRKNAWEGEVIVGLIKD